MNTGLELFQVQTMLQSMLLPETLDVAIVHGRSFGDEEEVFQVVADAYRTGLVTNVLISGTNGHRCGSNVPREAWGGHGVPG